MTPAVDLLEASGVPFALHRFRSTARTDYAREAARALDLDPARVYKTLIVQFPDGLGVALVPAAGSLALKSLAQAAGRRSAAMADQRLAERTTGYRVGAISPLGQKKRLPTYIDHSARAHATIYVSGARRGLEIEIAPDRLAELCAATFAAIAEG